VHLYYLKFLLIVLFVRNLLSVSVKKLCARVELAASKHLFVYFNLISIQEADEFFKIYNEFNLLIVT